MEDALKAVIMKVTEATQVELKETIQSLWSGYGSIDRYQLTGASRKSVIIKHVRLPEQNQHPRGWNTNRSHQRKLRSYQIESHWYETWSQQCDEVCRVADCLAVTQSDTEFLMIIEDLADSGYPVVVDSASLMQINSCLKWLANFHAAFMEVKPSGLWPSGTYWHLQTRPDELATMPDNGLKKVASDIDQILVDAPYQTLVHGDAKLANFCFSVEGSKVAAVDFQYVGGGCGMKDVAYFIGSCLDEHDCERLEAELLNQYFTALKSALAIRQPAIDSEAVETAWRPLYAVAWTDFYRFLQGWSPGHWKIHGYSERLANQVLRSIA